MSVSVLLLPGASEGRKRHLQAESPHNPIRPRGLSQGTATLAEFQDNLELGLTPWPPRSLDFGGEFGGGVARTLSSSQFAYLFQALPRASAARMASATISGATSKGSL